MTPSVSGPWRHMRPLASLLLWFASSLLFRILRLRWLRWSCPCWVGRIPCVYAASHALHSQQSQLRLLIRPRLLIPHRWNVTCVDRASRRIAARRRHGQQNPSSASSTRFKKQLQERRRQAHHARTSSRAPRDQRLCCRPFRVVALARSAYRGTAYHCVTGLPTLTLLTHYL